MATPDVADITSQEEITSQETKPEKPRPSKPRTRTPRAATSKPQVGTEKPEPTFIEQLQRVQATIYGALPEIVGALIDKAREGSYLHARCLFEVARLAELHVPAESANEPWAKLLLQELRKIPDPRGNRDPLDVNPSSFEPATKVSVAGLTEPVEWEAGDCQT